MSLGPLATSFAPLTDPRFDRTKGHLLLDIVLIAICAVVCGAAARGWVEVAQWDKKSWYHWPTPSIYQNPLIAAWSQHG